MMLYLASQAKLLCWPSCRLRSACFKLSEWIEFKFKMANVSKSDKVIIQTLREQELEAIKTACPIMPLVRLRNC